MHTNHAYASDLKQDFTELSATELDGTQHCIPSCAFVFGKLLGVNVVVLQSSDYDLPGESVMVVASFPFCTSSEAMPTLSSTIILWLQGNYYRAVVATQPLSVLVDRSAALILGDALFMSILVSSRILPLVCVHTISLGEAIRLALTKGELAV